MHADDSHRFGHRAHAGGTGTCKSTRSYGRGITKIDELTERTTLRHGLIKSLDIDSMTMLFRAKDMAMLKAVKVGD